MDSAVWLIIAAALAVGLLLLLVMRTKLQAFVALILVSILLGLGVGMSPQEIIATFEKGMGDTVAFIAIVIGLGAMFGEMLRVSGGAEQLALTMLNKFGEKKSPWALGVAGLIISVPVFLDVALVILVPILYTLANKSKKSLLFYGIPLLAGLLVTHGMVPPTPGPIAAASVLEADIGWVILFGLIAGIPAMILAGPLFGKFISKRIHINVPEMMDEQAAALAELEPSTENQKELPGFGTVLSLILLPLVLILFNTVSPFIFDEGSTIRTILTFIGDPYIALTITTLLTFYILGTKRGYTRDEIQQITTKSLEPAGIIILITGAGGIFGEVLVASGIGDVLANTMQQVDLPIVVFAFLTAALLRISIGSVTVAMVTTSSIVGPIVSTMSVSEPFMGVLVIAVASGSTIASHVNDSGFWMVNRYFGMSVADTLKSWTAMSTIVALVGFLVSLIISFFV
ncbi:gluconate:H+ symporter, GntP family/Gnt-I system low-affinity gluconate transporter [Salinibacillus kushneri]|uniref:Gluconate:H+ symporter, GntP family/Gnt-I system low-affinity gluconate transporter n=1 Tax=Salinibacillus kushneri TaxID=237682 RepID=A0A1H9Z9P2_9BACI|nr:gluconate:H+ symporter [Salinibacillus kushneri]SES78325.1 gluconate:H+ symporter, GntP family/Gnt-I system low-affinity gluconate transporter [Salinibacillus kushneri]